MANLYEMFKTDAAAEQQGFWYKFDTDTRFLLARAGGANSAYSKVMEAKTRPYRRQIENGKIDPKLSDEILAEAFAETVILNWEGVKDESGKAAKFSVKNATKLLTDLPELFAELREEALNYSNFQADEVEEDAGN